MPNGGVSLTFASVEDDEGDDVRPGNDSATAVQREDVVQSREPELTKYGLSSSAAKDLAERFKNGDAATSGFAGSAAIAADESWTPAEEGWGLARPDTSYDKSMGTKSAMSSLPSKLKFRLWRTLSPSNELGFDGLTPPSMAVGRGFDFSSAIGSAPGTSHSERNMFDLTAGAKPSPSGERGQRRPVGVMSLILG